MNEPGCELCTGPGGQVIHDDGRLRVVFVDEPDYPGFIRVIWNAHVRELTDLTLADLTHLMEVVFAVERCLRDVLLPRKINVASLGNQTPHLHWHLIPRFPDDAHFPRPVWAARERDADPGTLAARRSRLPALQDAIATALSGA